MPQRTGREKKVFGGPQGDDAFVVIQRLTVDENESFVKLFTKVDPKTADETEVEVRRRLANILIGWNWVDDDDSPLPNPHDNVELIGRLYNDELKYLLSLIMGNDKDEKKGKRLTRKP